MTAARARSEPVRTNRFSTREEAWMDDSGRRVHLPAQGGSVVGGSVAVVGGGPAGIVMAIALARRGIRPTGFERDQHPMLSPRCQADRCYTIDVTGHGLRALR